jgi:hypothetical protein
MKSYTILRNLYGVDTKNTSSANLLYGDQQMNDFIRRLLSKADWPFLHRLRTATTIASTTFVNLPYDVDQVESVFVTVSSTRYNPKPAPSRKFWDELHYTTQTSDTPSYWFVYNGQLGLWPRPSTSGNTISINAKIKPIDLNTADITTSTITTLANAGTALTVSGGLTVQMAGFWIRPTFSTTANTGDGQWYELASVTNATTATLVRPYGGVSITAGTAASTIAQLPLLPESAQDLPEIYASYRYWMKEKDERAAGFKDMLSDGVSTLFTTYGFNDLSFVLDDGEDKYILNPNLTISL